MKWVGWIARLLVTIVAVSMLSILTTGYVVNYYVQSILGSYNIPLDAQAPSIGGIVSGVFGFGDRGAAQEENDESVVDRMITETDSTGNPGANSDEGLDDKSVSTSASEQEQRKLGDGGETITEPGQSKPDGSGETTSGREQSKLNGDGGATPNGGGDKGNEDPASTDPEQGELKDAFPVMGGISAGNTASSGSQSQDRLAQEQQVVITPEDLTEKREQIPDQAKEEVFNILMKKLEQSEMQKMTEAMEDGLTEEEMIEIEQILSKRLNKKEYAKIIDFLQQ